MELRVVERMISFDKSHIPKTDFTLQIKTKRRKKELQLKEVNPIVMSDAD